MFYNFIYSTKKDKTGQKEIKVWDYTPEGAYIRFVSGLVKSATLVICKETGERII